MQCKYLPAPIGCLQYHTAASGTVTSFNYGETINGALVTLPDGTTRPGSRQIANLNYGICVDMLPGYCSIQWTNSKPFVLTAVTNGDELDDIANRGFSLDYTQMACSNLPNAFFMT
ncbi:hypothetical protein NQ314_001106 [Rhamnusium bicolor]|uniref:CUB domain-containing protein n=1 Tax=Rhamnusium bicolor TaxID=1586634 RepID=A0AAV8ZTK4_9CUCU|nr:hypothetical protein NQ314_001106 [Rhamnusium bicolor]